MLVEFNPDTLEPLHVVFHHPREYRHDLVGRSEHVAESAERFPLQEVEIVMGEGVLYYQLLEERTEHWLMLRGLPEDTRLTLNGVPHTLTGDVFLPLPDGKTHADAGPIWVKIETDASHDGGPHMGFEAKPGEVFQISVRDRHPMVRRRKPLELVVPSEAKVGEELTIAGVPEGVAIAVNDKPFGVMDDSGVLEFTPQVGGVYKFRLSGSGWITKQFEIEAK